MVRASVSLVINVSLGVVALAALFSQWSYVVVNNPCVRAARCSRPADPPALTHLPLSPRSNTQNSTWGRGIATLPLSTRCIAQKLSYVICMITSCQLALKPSFQN